VSLLEVFSRIARIICDRHCGYFVAGASGNWTRTTRKSSLRSESVRLWYRRDRWKCCDNCTATKPTNCDWKWTRYRQWFDSDGTGQPPQPGAREPFFSTGGSRSKI